MRAFSDRRNVYSRWDGICRTSFRTRRQNASFDGAKPPVVKLSSQSPGEECQREPGTCVRRQFLDAAPRPPRASMPRDERPSGVPGENDIKAHGKSVTRGETCSRVKR